MKVTIGYLDEKGFEDSRLTVELLLSHALGMPRIQLYTGFEKPISAEELQHFRSLIERRLKREPVQYITGTTGFMGLQFDVTPAVLIPRPETETLVEQAMIHCKSLGGSRPVKVLDLCTGSGCIAVALAKFFPALTATAVDISEDALRVARANAGRHGVEDRVEFMRLDVHGEEIFSVGSGYDLLVSNPPYVAIDEWDELAPELRLYEPRAALTDERDGCTFYWRIIGIAGRLAQGPVILEAGFGKTDSIMRAMTAAGFSNVASVLDLQGVPRVAVGIAGQKGAR